MQGIAPHWPGGSEKLCFYRARGDCIYCDSDGRQFKRPSTGNAHQSAFGGKVSCSISCSENGSTANIHYASCRGLLEGWQASLSDLYRGPHIQVKDAVECLKVKFSPGSVL